MGQYMRKNADAQLHTTRSNNDNPGEVAFAVLFFGFFLCSLNSDLRSMLQSYITLWPMYSYMILHNQT